MSDLIAGMVCTGGLLGLMGLVFMAVWQNAQHGDHDGYRALQSRCAELDAALYSVKDQRNQLARRVCELERYYSPAQRQAKADWQTITHLNQENQDLRKRLDGARVLVLALASKAGVQVDQDPGSGQWRAV